jgi:hypothetical protein
MKGRMMTMMAAMLAPDGSAGVPFAVKGTFEPSVVYSTAPRRIKCPDCLYATFRAPHMVKHRKRAHRRLDWWKGRKPSQKPAKEVA